MMPPSVLHTEPADGEVVQGGVLRIHGHTLHILGDDALSVVEPASREEQVCPVTIETFDEGDLESDFPGSMQVRCVLSVDVRSLSSGRTYEVRLNLLSDVYVSRFRIG